MAQLPSLKKQFPDYASYANATTKTLLTYLPSVQSDTINELRSGYLDHHADGWTFVPFPQSAQVAPVFSITEVPGSINKGNRFLLTGNASKTRVKIGEIDANHGVLLERAGGDWRQVPDSGLWIRGDVRSSAEIQAGSVKKLVIGRNGLPLMVYDIVNPAAIQ